MTDPSPRLAPRILLLAGFALVLLGPGRAAAQLTVEDLEDVVAPIALYPDDILRYVLPASAFLDQMEAARAVQKASEGQPDPDSPEVKALDDSVQALLPFPDVVQMFVDFPDWGRELGDAVATQQADVMDAIQSFRRRVHEVGNLKSDDNQKIIVETEVIRIEPAEPEVIYVPVYEPATVVVYQPHPVLTYTTAFIWASWRWHGHHWGYWGGCHWHSHTTINIHGGHWRAPPAYRPRPRPHGYRPPGSRPGGGRRPGVRPPAIPRRAQAGTTPRNTAARQPAAGQRPSTRQQPAAGQRPATTQRPAVKRPPAQKPTFQSSQSSRGAFNNVNSGSRARQNSARGQQSRSRSSAGSRGGGASRGGGGGRRR